VLGHSDDSALATVTRPHPYPLSTTVTVSVPNTDAPDDVVELCNAIPGIWCKNAARGFYLRGPLHGWPLAKRLLEAAAGGPVDGLKVDVKIPDGICASDDEYRDRLARSELRPDGLGSLRSYQARAARWGAFNGGGHTWHAAGSGKTRSATVLALQQPWEPAGGDGGAGAGGVLVVTKGGVRYQYARDMQAIADVDPYVCDPAERTTARWESPWQYATRCWEDGKRPVWIVGWEELPVLVYGDGAWNRGGRRTKGGGDDGGGDEDGLVDSSPAAPTITDLTAWEGVGPKLAAQLVEAFADAPPSAVLEAAREGDGERFLTAAATIPRLSRARAEALCTRFREPPTGTARERALAAAADRRSRAYDDIAGFLQAPWCRFDTVVFDEIQMAKSRERAKWSEDSAGRLVATSRNNRTAAAMDVSLRAKWRWGTTATPMGNVLSDLWGVITLIDPAGWGKSYWRWVDRTVGVARTEAGYRDDKGRGTPHTRAELRYRLGLGDLTPMAPSGMVLGEAGRRAFGKLLRPHWRSVDRVRLAESHADLPPKRRTVMWLSPSALPQAPAKRMQAVRDAPNAGARRIAQLEVECARKRGEVAAMVREALLRREKVVVLTALREDVVDLRGAVEGMIAGVPALAAAKVPRWAVSGDDSPKARDAACQAFMAAPGGPEGGPGAWLVATGYSVGVGMNLHDADLAILTMIPPTPEAAEQWEQRFYRVGGRRKVEIRWLPIAHTIEEEQVYALMPKLETVDDTVGVGDAGTLAAGLRGWGNSEERGAVIARMVAKVGTGDAVGGAADSGGAGAFGALADGARPPGLEDWEWEAFGGG